MSLMKSNAWSPWLSSRYFLFGNHRDANKQFWRAAILVQKWCRGKPEIMVPLVGFPKGWRFRLKSFMRLQRKFLQPKERKVKYMVI